MFVLNRIAHKVCLRMFQVKRANKACFDANDKLQVSKYPRACVSSPPRLKAITRSLGGCAESQVPKERVKAKEAKKVRQG